MGRVGRSVAGFALAGALGLLVAGPAGAGAEGVTLTATIDTTPVGRSTETRPVVLRPDRPAQVGVEIRNAGSSPVEIRTVRVSGRVMGLTFFAYDTAVRLVVDPGTTVSGTYPLDLGDLDGQATGLIVGAVGVYDEDRDELASDSMVVDVRGSLRSVYGVFGIGVATLTAVSLVALFVAVARHRLPPNRWRRAVRFLGPGIGLGLTIVFTLSALRVFVPRPGRWVPIVVVCAAVAFAGGYLSPTPDEPGDDDEDEEDDEGGGGVLPVAGGAGDTPRPAAGGPGPAGP